MSDWREDYVICEHLAKNKDIKVYHLGFRVCCEECMEKGFLLSKHLNKHEEGKLTIGKLENEVVMNE